MTKYITNVEQSEANNVPSARDGEDKMKTGNTQPEPDEKPRLSGLAATLQRLRETGELAQHKQRQQTGRGKSVQHADDDDDDDGIDNSGNANGSQSKGYKPHVNLTYVDDQGNELTPKEAFRMLCHKFHGNYPGKNKNEKRLLKILENKRLRELQDSNDTPLAAVAALRNETQKLGNAHVVLSGTQAFQTAPTESKTLGSTGEDSSTVGAQRKRHRDDAGASGDERDGNASASVAAKIDEKVEFTIGAPGVKPAKMRRRQ